MCGRYILTLFLFSCLALSMIPSGTLTVRSQIYSLYYQKRPLPSFWEDDACFIHRVVMKLGPLPDDWQSRWEEIQGRSKDLQGSSEFLTSQSWSARNLPLYSLFLSLSLLPPPSSALSAF